MRLAWGVAALAMALSTVGCTQTGGESDAGPGFDTGSRDTGADAPARRCTSDPECDDSLECTIDSCVVGNVCEHRPLDAMCPMGQRCVVGSGCDGGCTTDSDCDDASFCSGEEQCLGGSCVVVSTPDCDDGNECTNDRCDSTLDGCAYETADGCDAGVAGRDGGIVCAPFDAATGYTGTHRIVPTQSSDCGAATYSIGEISMSVSDGTLTVRAGRFTLTGAAPSGDAFDVSGDDGGCGEYRLTGTFTCANRFTGRWLASFGGACGSCSSQDATVTGVRR